MYLSTEGSGTHPKFISRSTRPHAESCWKKRFSVCLKRTKAQLLKLHCDCANVALCYSTAVLLFCYSCTVAVLLLHFAILLLYSCCTVVILLLHCCYVVFSLLLCIFALLLYYCWAVALSGETALPTGSVCGSAGRVVASFTRDLRFNSSHQQNSMLNS